MNQHSSMQTSYRKGKRQKRAAICAAATLLIMSGLASQPASASTSYCGHGTDGIMYYHTFQNHFYGAGPYMHYIAGWSPFADGYIDHYDGIYCTN
jgi:hypothetical protein